MMKTQSFLVKSFSLIFLLSATVGFAKTDNDQNEIILLNDLAAALEDSNPQLSKNLSEFAEEREKQWDDRTAHPIDPSAALSPEEIVQIRQQLKLLNEALPQIKSTYPLIALGLKRMIKELGAKVPVTFNGAFVGMQESDFFNIYPVKSVRGLRHEGEDEWFTYNDPLDDPLHHIVTFYFHHQQLAQWKLDDRPEAIKEYLNEFCFYQPPSLTYEAIKNVMQRMPYEDFLNITNRERPVLFTEFYVEGTARFASSSEFIVTPNDPPCCKEGFTIVKLGMSLGLAKTPAPIEAVVAHELAHRVLDSIRKGNVNCDAERAANRLIRKWGFTEELKQASQLFGQRKGDPAACQEVHQTKPGDKK